MNIIGNDPLNRLVDNGSHPVDDTRVTILSICTRCQISSLATVSEVDGKFVVNDSITVWPGRPAEAYTLRFNSRRVARAWMNDYAPALLGKEITLFDSDADLAAAAA
jgi:hypothetical protein